MSLVNAIDVSNYQPADLSAIIAQYQPEHVVVRASTEGSTRRKHARLQVESAVANGCTASCYPWVYFDLNPVEHTADAMSVMDGLPVEMFWFDCEGVSANGRLDHWLSQAVSLVESRGKRAGIYTSAPWWRKNGDSHGFSRLPLWLADWTGNPDLAPPSLGWFGGWTTLAGRQWTSTNETMDRDVFDPAVLAPPVDHCAELRDGIKGALADMDALRARLAALVS